MTCHLGRRESDRAAKLGVGKKAALDLAIDRPLILLQPSRNLNLGEEPVINVRFT